MNSPLRPLRLLLAGLSLVSCAAGGSPTLRAESGSSVLEIVTSEGTITVEVMEARAPKTSEFVLGLVDEGRFDGTNFYRAGYLAGRTDGPRLIEGGLMDRLILGEIIPLPNNPQEGGVPYAADWETTGISGLSHVRGTLSLARDLTGSGVALADIVIITADQTELDEGGSHGFDAKGFPAFGVVVSGMDVADRIVAREADGKSAVPFLQGQVLRNPVTIKSISRRKR